MNSDVFTFIDLNDNIDTSNLRIKSNHDYEYAEEINKVIKTKNTLTFGEENFIKQKLMYLESVECRNNFTKDEIDISRKYYTKCFQNIIKNRQMSFSSSTLDSMPSLTLPQ